MLIAKFLRTLAGPNGLALAMMSVMALAVVAAMLTFAPRESVAKPAYAAATGRPCTACHTTPPKLNACGQKYKTNKSTKC